MPFSSDIVQSRIATPLGDVRLAASPRGLAGLWLDTFAFQAKDFYEKLGFSVFGEIDDHPRGSRRHFLMKRL